MVSDITAVPRLRMDGQNTTSYRRYGAGGAEATAGPFPPPLSPLPLPFEGLGAEGGSFADQAVVAQSRTTASAKAFTVAGAMLACPDDVWAAFIAA